MFFKVTLEHPRSTVSNAWLPPLPHISSTAKIILKVNLQTLCIVLLLTPINVARTYVYVSEDSCEDNPQLMHVIRYLGILSIISSLCYPLLVYKKLENFVT